MYGTMCSNGDYGNYSNRFAVQGVLVFIKLTPIYTYYLLYLLGKYAIENLAIGAEQRQIILNNPAE